MTRIILTGGGTGGHLFPLVAVARKIKELSDIGNLGEPEIYYLGPGLFLESSLEREEMNFHYTVLITGKWRRYASFKNFIDIFKTIAGIIQSLIKVWIIMPDVAFSKGGYGSVATVFACWLYRVPVILHESDSAPGLANRVLSRFAAFIAVSWSETAKYFPSDKTYFTGEAVRDAFFEPPKPEMERALLHLTTKKPVILVLGGSQGAQKINDVILDILPRLLEIFEVIHQTGDSNYNSVFSESRIILEGMAGDKFVSYHPVNFMIEPEYIAAMHSADIIISRSGAGSIFEIAASGRASVLIPISNSPNDHARRNAYIFAAGGRAEVVEEENLTPNLLLSVISSMINDNEKKIKMERLAKEFATPEAAKLIAQALINLIPK